MVVLEKKSDGKFAIVTLLYLGLRESQDGKLYHAYLEIPSDKAERLDEDKPSLKSLISDGIEELWYSKPLTKYTMPGYLISVEKSEAGDVKGTGRDYVGAWHNEQDRTNWQADTQAIKTKRAKEREQKKQTSANLIYEHLDPIKESYSRLTVARKRAFLAYIIEYITR